jgi:alpha-L-arabinofuranosidase
MLSSFAVAITLLRFVAWCREGKIEPYIVLNMGTGTLEEALRWIEYCNGTGDT